MVGSRLHEDMMKRCLELARRGVGKVSPNPAVGAVLVAGGKIISEDFHRIFGGPHAEAACLNKLDTVPGNATLYVNLEPCAHHGKTPPCTDRIIAAGVRSVVIGMIDPNPLVSGKGVRKLRSAGVRVVTGIMNEECLALNRPFVRNMRAGLPYVHLKVAVTIDGKLGGASRWITSKPSRLVVHRARAVHDAVLVGAGTVVRDNPRLDVRLLRGRNPAVVVLDGRLRAPTNARVFTMLPDRDVILCTSDRAGYKARSKVNSLRKRGVHILTFKASDGLIPLREVCRKLLEMQIGSVLVEGGEQVSGAFFQAGLVDELSMFLAPAVAGGMVNAFRLVNGVPLRQHRRRISHVTARNVGPDLLVSYLYH